MEMGGSGTPVEPSGGVVSLIQLNTDEGNEMLTKATKDVVVKYC